MKSSNTTSARKPHRKHTNRKAADEVAHWSAISPDYRRTVEMIRDMLRRNDNVEQYAVPSFISRYETV